VSNNDVKQISDATGTFRTLQPNANTTAPKGRFSPETGKNLPVTAMEEPDPGSLASKLNVTSQTIGRDLRFRVDMNSGRSVIQVLDRDTGEIIREIPPEKARISIASNGNMHISLYDEIA